MKKYILLIIMMFVTGIFTVYSQQTTALQQDGKETGQNISTDRPSSPNPQLSIEEQEAALAATSQMKAQEQQATQIAPEFNPNKPSSQEPGENQQPVISTPSLEQDNLSSPNNPNGRKSDTQ